MGSINVYLLRFIPSSAIIGGLLLFCAEEQVSNKKRFPLNTMPGVAATVLLLHRSNFFEYKSKYSDKSDQESDDVHNLQVDSKNVL